jgi:hypothetical protein
MTGELARSDEPGHVFRQALSKATEIVNAVSSTGDSQLTVIIVVSVSAGVIILTVIVLVVFEFVYKNSFSDDILKLNLSKSINDKAKISNSSKFYLGNLGYNLIFGEV